MKIKVKFLNCWQENYPEEGPEVVCVFLDEVKRIKKTTPFAPFERRFVGLLCSRWPVCNHILWLSESRKACIEGRIPAVAH